MTDFCMATMLQVCLFSVFFTVGLWILALTQGRAPHDASSLIIQDGLVWPLCPVSALGYALMGSSKTAI